MQHRPLPSLTCVQDFDSTLLFKYNVCSLLQIGFHSNAHLLCISRIKILWSSGETESHWGAWSFPECIRPLITDLFLLQFFVVTGRQHNVLIEYLYNSLDAITEVIVSKVHFKKWQKIISNLSKKRHDQYN